MREYGEAVVKVMGFEDHQTSATCPFEHEFTRLVNVNDSREQYLYSGEVFKEWHRDNDKALGFRTNITQYTFPISFRKTSETRTRMDGLRMTRIGYVKIHNDWR